MSDATTTIPRLTATELLIAADENYTPAGVSLWRHAVREARETMGPADWFDAVQRSAPLTEDEVHVLADVLDSEWDEMPNVPWIEYADCNDYGDCWTAAYSAALGRAAERIRDIEAWVA